jgi:hypothetical protein
MSIISRSREEFGRVVALFRDYLALTIERRHNERFMELVDRAMPNWRNYREQS